MAALAARHKKGTGHKWLAYLFDLFRAYAAIRLWISDIETFEDTVDPQIVQNCAISEWNRFHTQYPFGSPFRYVVNKEGQNVIEKPYLHYETQEKWKNEEE